MATQTETQPEGAIIRDQELKAINEIVKKLLALDRPAQLRVMNYICGRFPAPESNDQ